jgi:hypothetical protein
MLVVMDDDRDLEFEVGELLYDLCVRLGFCLPPEANRRLVEAPPAGVDAFTDAVFEAEGMGDMSYTDLRRQVRAVVDQHMNRWPRR